MSQFANIYQIRIQGAVHGRWQEWFGPLALTHLEDGNTLLRGPVQDQSQLVGIINQIHSLNLTLLSVNRESEAEYFATSPEEGSGITHSEG